MTYYTRGDGITEHTLGRAAAVTDELDAIAAAFDTLPDADDIKSGGALYATDSGSANACVLTSAYPATGYSNGLTRVFAPAADNTGQTTVNLDGLGVKNLVRFDGSDLGDGNLVAGKPVFIAYYGSAFVLLSHDASDVASAADSATSASSSATSAASSATSAASSAASATSSASSASSSATSAASSATSAAAYATKIVQIAVTNPGGAALATGDGQAYFRVNSALNGFKLTGVAGALSNASSSGAPNIQIYNVTQSRDLLSTPLTIDANETDSSMAATPAVVDTASSHNVLTTGDLLRIDIDGAGTGAKGLIVEMTISPP